ncbi:MAG: glycosyltransferase family 4 protein [Deltaproteobacteria bacterium]|nr:glycosyltransferase family 4 protein [Deltaproteobacteria bacterium]
MKLAIIRRSYTPFGGAELYLNLIIQALLGLGHEVHIYASKWQASAQPGLFFHRVNEIKLFSFIGVLSFALRCKKLLTGHDYDAVLSIERTLLQDIFYAQDGCHKEWLRQRRQISGWWKRITFHINPLHLCYLWIERRLFQDPKLKKVIAISHRCKEEMIRHYGLADSKITVIHNAIVPVAPPGEEARQAGRDALLNEYNLSDDHLLLLFVGSGFNRKGVDFIIKAMPRLIIRGIKPALFVVGRGSPRPYRHLVSSLGLLNKVFFTGPVTEPFSRFFGCDIFVFPSIYEPFGIACLEAMAHGLPVITSRISGVSEVVEPGVNGLVVSDPTNPDQIADQIESLADETTRRNMGRAAIARVAGLTIQENVAKIMSVINEVAEHK